MKAFILFVLLIFTSNTFSQNVPHLFELRGLEDSLANTHLFYRYRIPVTSCWIKSIYHFDVNNVTDTLFIYDAASDPIGEGCRGQYVYDYEFFDNDPAKYIYGGYDFYIDPVALLIRYDGQIQINSFGGITDIEISHQNDSLVYAALGGGLFKSTDGGYNFTINLDSLAWIDNAMISLSDNDDSQIYGIDQNKLARSEDEGQSYIIVDDDIHWGWNYEKELYYDADGQHIYGVSTSSNESALLISDDNGNPFTWDLKLSRPGLITFALEEQNPGEVYYSYNKSIYKSIDFGNTFSLYKELEQKITGLYKKCSTNILYASTLFRIYEIDLPNGSIKIIKSITPVYENYNWYPLSVGNYWLYEKFIIENGTTQFVGYETRHIVDNIVKQNGKKYFKLLINYSGSSTDSLFIRLDSTTAQIFAFDHSIGDELFFEDLSAELGDTVCYDYNPAWTCQYVQLEEEFSVFGLTTLKKVYEPEAPGWYFGHSLVKGIGLYKLWNGDTVPFWAILKGSIIDGVVYGDTTVVSVEDETPNNPTEFSLSQNYPNPFNPTTTIRFTIPQSPLLGGDGRGGLVTLKVYDILGNEVATLVKEELPTGEYEVEFDGTGLVSGVYFYQLKAGGFVSTKKFVLIK